MRHVCGDFEHEFYDFVFLRWKAYAMKELLISDNSLTCSMLLIMSTANKESDSVDSL